MAKIIKRDNFNRETESEYLVAESCNEFYAKRITDLLNQAESECSPNFYVAVEDNYQLYKFEI